MLNRFFQDELEYLRDLARDFAREYPSLAPALSEASSDPDVERVLEGTAFLTASLRQKLEDDLPELTQSMISMLWPHYLRPLPSTSILEFRHPSKVQVTSCERLAAGEVEVDSVPVDGTPCRFRTCYDVDFRPLEIVSASFDPERRGALRIGFEILGGAALEDLSSDRIRLYLHGELASACNLHMWLMRQVEQVAIECEIGGSRHRASLSRDLKPIQPVGFAPDEAVIPYPTHSFPGYRLLQEYITLPQKFLFVDLVGLEAPLLSLGPESRFDVVIDFRERPPENLRVGPESLRLHCTPIVNLTSRDADPIRVDHKRTSYLVRPTDPEPTHFEVFSVDRVVGIHPGSSRRQEYKPFYTFRSGLEVDLASQIFYQIERREAIGVPNSTCHMSFVTSEERGALPEAEVVSIDLTCTNRRMAESLKPGDISRHTERSPQFAEFRNIAPLTTSVLPPLRGGFHWRLISHLALNYVSLLDAEALRSVLALYDFPALHDRQAALAAQRRLESIEKVESRAGERLFRGAVLRGQETLIQVDEECFSSDGEVHLFSSLLEEFLAMYVTVNAYSQLTVQGSKKRERYTWPPRIGQQFSL